MARKRMLDPSIWTDEGMAELTARQQLLYIGLLSNADDEGRIRGSASSIRLILPTVYAAVDLGNVADDLAQVLRSMRQLVAYVADGREYLAFRKYHQWQKIDHPSASTLPAPPDCSSSHNGVLTDDSPNVRRMVDEPSPNVRASRARAEVSLGKSSLGKEKLDEEGDAPAADAAPPASVPKPNRTQQVIDLLAEEGVEVHPRPQDGKAIKNSGASPEDIVAVYLAIYYHEFGDDFMLRNLSLQSAIAHLDGYRASQHHQLHPPPPEGFLGASPRAHVGRRGGIFD